ncbi:MAG: hypothetical protein EU532_03125 [Promethearchaeota archaeon]|nr:MAG: hypothetical protein EU532_03125 [Candidatus Lokiarchaeota archaeon]
MSENQKEEVEEESDNDLETYLREMEELGADFSDLDDLDLEEIQDMQDAIAKVKEQEASMDIESPITQSESKDLEGSEIKTEIAEETEYLQQKEALIEDFSDMEQIDFDELREMKEAIESVKQEDLTSSSDLKSETTTPQGISIELEEKIRQELLKKKEKKEEEVITPEKFLDYIKNKREKIWYHALYYLVFNVEDHISTKSLLYDVLKEVTSKSAIDPIPEHQFYFGLGYILRLILNDKKIIRYMSGGKFKVNINVNALKEILKHAGEPISTRPVIKEEVKKKMFTDFLKDDFSDI